VYVGPGWYIDEVEIVGLGVPDSYEPDNTAGQANIIQPGTTPQEHNFHISGDEDWVKFSGLTNDDYIIEAFNLESGADIELQLYDTDGTTLIKSEDTTGNPQADEILEHKLNKDGTYYVKVINKLSSGNNTGYELIAFRAAGMCLVTFTVNDADSSQPITNVNVEITACYVSKTTNDGNFAFHLPFGPCSIKVEADGYAPYEDPTFIVPNQESYEYPLIPMTTMIIHDLDDDGDVDIVDIMMVASRWNTATGDPNYDSPYDLDNDGDIDIVDVMNVAAQWGWKK
jgi:hypothetical protein